jgi:hypothetical protein
MSLTTTTTTTKDDLSLVGFAIHSDATIRWPRIDRSV